MRWAIANPTEPSANPTGLRADQGQNDLRDRHSSPQNQMQQGNTHIIWRQASLNWLGSMFSVLSVRNHDGTQSF